MRLAVVDPLPMYRQGVATVLSAAGHTVETPDDLLAWGRKGGLVLLTLATDPHWQLLRRLHAEAGECPVIAMLAEESAAIGARAVRSGARSVLGRGVAALTLVRTVDATAEGQTVLPAGVTAALIAGVSDPHGELSGLNSEQQTWLRHLAAGMTTARLAELTGYSERAMFRLLQVLYRRLGARNRVEAIVRAQQQGLLLGDGEISPPVAGQRRR